MKNEKKEVESFLNLVDDFRAVFEPLMDSAIQSKNNSWKDWDPKAADLINGIYLKMSKCIPTKKVVIDFIEGHPPFQADSYTHALMTFTVPQYDEYGEHHLFGRQGFARLYVSVQLEWKRTAIELKQSKGEKEESLKDRIEDLLFGDMMRKEKISREQNVCVVPLTQEEIKAKLGENISQSKISRLMKETLFKSQDEYIKYFRKVITPSEPLTTDDLSATDFSQLSQEYDLE